MAEPAVPLAALCVAAARRPTRTSAWQNTPPAASVPVRGALARGGSRGGRRRRVLVRPRHAEFYRRPPRGRDARTAEASLVASRYTRMNNAVGNRDQGIGICD